jgi:hypothetical protein
MASKILREKKEVMRNMRWTTTEMRMINKHLRKYKLAYSDLVRRAVLNIVKDED